MTKYDKYEVWPAPPGRGYFDQHETELKGKKITRKINLKSKIFQN